jgi:hypothetical protein
MVQGDLGILQFPGFTIGAAEGFGRGIWSPLTVDASDLSGRRLKVIQIPGGRIALAETDDAGYYGLVTMSNADAAGKAWKTLTVGNIAVTLVATTIANVFALLTIDVADASAANYRRFTIDGGTITLVETGTPGKRAVLIMPQTEVGSTAQSAISILGRALVSAGGGLLVQGGTAPSYAEKVLAAFGASLIDYRKLDELSGTAAADSSPKQHAAGVYSGVTLNSIDGPTAAMGRAGSWDGVNDYADIYSAGLNTDFDGLEFSLAAWVKVSAASVWTDGATRTFARITNASNDTAYLRKEAGNNTLIARYFAGGTLKSVSFTFSGTGWFHFMMTVSKSAAAGSGEFKAYLNGAQQGTTQTALGTWSGALVSSGAAIGAAANNGSEPHSGNLAHCVLLNRPTTAGEITTLATAV